MPLASITATLTHWIGQNGVYAVFALMALDALLPAGGELIMLYAGVLSAGAIAGQQASLLGVQLSSGPESYIVLALAGTLGYLAGAVAGWAIGRSGGRPLLERHGRWVHLSTPTFRRAERWFERFGVRAVFLGRITPVVRSFISIPAGVFRTPMATYLPLTLAGSAIWCFGFAAAGWAVGGSWERFHHQFRYADYAAVAGSPSRSLCWSSTACGDAPTSHGRLRPWRKPPTETRRASSRSGQEVQSDGPAEPTARRSGPFDVEAGHTPAHDAVDEV